MPGRHRHRGWITLTGLHSLVSLCVAGIAVLSGASLPSAVVWTMASLLSLVALTAYWAIEASAVEGRRRFVESFGHHLRTAPIYLGQTIVLVGVANVLPALIWSQRALEVSLPWALLITLQLSLGTAVGWWLGRRS